MLIVQIVNIFLYICFVNGNKLWKKVLVNDYYFQGNPSIILVTSSLITWQCGVSCDQNPECKTWCHDGQSCFLTKMLVSALHESVGAPTKTCFTNMEDDYILGVVLHFRPFIQAFRLELH